MRRFLLATSALAMLTEPALGHAQVGTTEAVAPKPTPEAGAAAPSGKPAGLSELVITAQRRSENLQHAAMAVSAVSGAALVSAGVTQPSDLTALVPSLQIAPASGPYSLFYLRGVGNFNGNALSDSAIAFNFDGVYVGRPSGTTGFFYDLDRVEVLKGPQGTLYGRNATGGAINVISHRADLDRYEGDASLEYGNYNTVRADGDVNIPLGDKAALRVAGTYVSHDGYMKDGTDDQDDAGGRVTLRLEPTSTLSINVVADYYRQRGEGVGGTPINAGVDSREGFFSPAGRAFLSAEPNELLGQNFTPFTAKPFLHNDYWGVSSTIEWRTPIGVLTVVPAHREGELNYRSDAPGFTLQQQENDQQNSIEARLASSDAQPLRYLLGAFYYKEINDVPVYYVNQESNVNLDNYKQNDESKAVFGRLTYAVTPSFRLNVGARYTSEDKTLGGELLGAIRACVIPSSYYPSYTPGCPGASSFPVQLSVPAPNFNPTTDGTLTIPVNVDETGANAKHASFSKLTYRAGADWDVTAQNLLYASYETGFKSGGFFFTSDDGVFKPESIAAWTVGSKNRFFDNRLQLNIEGFSWLYRNQQISHLVEDSAGADIFATQNVGRASFKGAEVETRFLLTETTELNADIQYLDAVYSSYTYSVPNSNGGVGNGTGCPNLGTPGATYTINCSGYRPPNAPKWTLNLGGQQTFSLNDGGKVVGAVRGHYQTETLTGLEFTTIEYQPAYWDVDLQLAYTDPSNRYTLSAYANNLLDTTVISNTFEVPFSAFTAGSLRPPRTFGVRAQVKF